jgi:hypothetical protein
MAIVYSALGECGNDPSGMIRRARRIGATETSRPDPFTPIVHAPRLPLMGSWGYTEAPTVPMERTVVMFNMDMIGRNCIRTTT